MNGREIRARIAGPASGLGALVRRRWRLALAVAVVALLLAPLALGAGGEGVVLNAVCVGLVGLQIRRLAWAVARARVRRDRRMGRTANSTLQRRRS